MAINKARLVTGQEDNSMSLLNSLAKSSRREMNLSPVTLSLVITKPVLQERRVQRRRAQAVESEALAGMNHGQFTRQCQHGTLGSGICQLGGSSADEGHDGSSVDDAALGLVVAAQSENGVLAAEPYTFYVDVLGQVPDGLGGVDGVVVLGVHDAGVVEDDVEAAPGVDGFNEGLDVGFFGDVAFLKQSYKLGDGALSKIYKKEKE